MIIFILIQLSISQNTYIATIQTDTTQFIRTNFTSNVNSLIVKFYLHQSNTLCLISDQDLQNIAAENIDLEISDKYDYQGYLAGSEYQLVQVDYLPQFYVKCLQMFNINTIQQPISYELFYSDSNLIQGCINNCNGYNYPEQSESICISNSCHCLDGAFGQFCQFQSTKIESNVQTPITIDEKEWKYLQYQFSSTDITLLCNDQIDNLLYSFVLKQNPQVDIPSIDSSKQLNTSVNIQQSLRYLQSNIYVDVIYIGLFNNQTKQIILQFQLVTTEDDSESTIERNKIIIIVTGCVVGGLLLFAFALSALKSRQQRQFHRQVQEAIRQNMQQMQNDDQLQRSPVRQLDPVNNKGFSLRFIKDHFKGHQYEKIVKSYPGLSQFEECVVCLEQMKNAATKIQKICSVTPCFHIFHCMCLEEWLLRQKNCPFCRTEYTRKKIIKDFPWLEVNTIRVTNSDSTYLCRMRNQNQNQIESQNESQIELGKSQQVTHQIQEIED